MVPNRIAQAVLLAALLAAPTYAEVGATQQEDPLFDKLDADADGFISRAESTKDERVAERFESLDGNKDDRLDKIEFEALRGIDQQRTPEP